MSAGRRVGVHRAMDEFASKALASTKSLHRRLKELDPIASGIAKTELCELAKLAATANRAVVALQRHAHASEMQASVRERVLRSAIHSDLIDREANAARVMDKERTLVEQAGGSDIHERAHLAARVVERSLATLCPHQKVRTAPGVAFLAAEGASAPRALVAP